MKASENQDLHKSRLSKAGNVIQVADNGPSYAKYSSDKHLLWVMILQKCISRALAQKENKIRG